MSLLKTEEQARLSAAAAAADRSLTEAARLATETARDIALAAQAETESARDEALNYGDARIERSWAALAAVTGMAAGDTAQVLSTDTGTHTDPVVGGTVKNAGVFKYSASPAGWERIADLQGQIAADEANRAAVLAYLASNPFADTTALNAYSNAALTVGDSTTIVEDGRYEVTSLSPLTWTRTGDSDGKVAADAAAVAGSYAALSFPFPHFVGGMVVAVDSTGNIGSSEAEMTADQALALARSVFMMPHFVGGIMLSVDSTGNLAPGDSPVLAAVEKVDEFVFDPAESATIMWFIIWLLGQSNNYGNGTAASAYTIPANAGFMYKRDAGAGSPGLVQLTELSGQVVAALDDSGNPITATPKGSSSAGLGWEMLLRTNGKIGVIVCNSAVGGSHIGDFGDGTKDWSSDGGCWTNAVTDMNNLLSIMAAARMPVAGCAVITSQGESESGAITDDGWWLARFAGTSVDAGGGLDDRVRALLGSKVPHIITRTGRMPGKDISAIAASQDRAAAELPNVFMGYSATSSFTAADRESDNIHYRTFRQDEIGRHNAALAARVGMGVIPKGYHITISGL